MTDYIWQPKSKEDIINNLLIMYNEMYNSSMHDEYICDQIEDCINALHSLNELDYKNKNTENETMTNENNEMGPIVNYCSCNVNGNFYCTVNLTDDKKRCSFFEEIPDGVKPRLSKHDLACYQCAHLYDRERWYTDGYYCRCKEAVDHAKIAIAKDEQLIKDLAK